MSVSLLWEGSFIVVGDGEIRDWLIQQYTWG